MVDPVRRSVLAGMLAATAGFARAAEAGGSEVAITIDDLDVNADDTPRLNLEERNIAILQTLRRHRLQAALFVCGMRVDNEVGQRHLREWGRQGHLIGNHTYSHIPYSTTTFEKFSADTLRCEALISGVHGFRRIFRFPALKEGATREQRDRMRSFLREHRYRMGYVTIDSSDWALDARLRKRLDRDPQADVTPYRNFLLEHIWQRAQFYDGLARAVLGRPVRHTMLIHHNLMTALFLDDLLQMFAARGWHVIDAGRAFRDPVFDREPDIVPAGESLVWALAKATGRYEAVLRYPGEDDVYENPRMDELGL
jgi:peptidoglycan/xylan/chitin deacetylase (PgdA/CDA1 family)